MSRVCWDVLKVLVLILLFHTTFSDLIFEPLKFCLVVEIYWYLFNFRTNIYKCLLFKH